MKKNDYEFIGWNTKANGRGKNYKNKAKIKSSTKKNNKKIVLYANWTKKVTVTKEENNNTTIYTITPMPSTSPQQIIPTLDEKTVKKYVDWERLTQKNVYKTLIKLKKKYPNRSSWDNSICYEWTGGYFKKGCGCAGFAFLLSDVAFYNRTATMHKNFDNIKIGDTIRLDSDSHTVIALKVKKDYIVVAEGNYQGQVRWGRKISIDEVKKTGTYVLTRY